MEWIDNVGYAYEHVANLGNKWIPKDTASVNPNFQMPRTINGTILVAVGPNGFEHNDRLRAFNANPANDLYLSERAFAECKNLQNVNLNGSVGKTSVHVYSNAFWNCSALKEVSSNRPTYFYGSKQFAYCGELEVASIRVMNHVPGGCFWKCKKLKSVEFLHWGELRIADNAFEKCHSLEQIIFHGNVCASEVLLQQLKNVTIRCKEDSNLADLAYNGWKIEIF